MRQVSYADSFYAHEINSNNIIACARTSRFLWVHLWRPYCKANACQNISFYPALADRYKANGLNLLFISESYDLKSIRNAVDNNGFNRPIYVLQDSYYGHDLNDARKKFSEMNFSQIQDPDLIIYDDYIFKDTLIIFACKEINKIMIDSILSVNTR
jgi:hypothetical protein